MSRGETAVWIYNMENQPDAGEPHSFTDVTDASQNDAISWMADKEITTGKSDTTFAPDETLKRAEAAAFLHRLKGEPSAPPHNFSDVVATWQQDAVSWMAHTGITTGVTTGTSPTFAPEDTLTRAQLITFLYRYQGEPDVTLDASTPHCDPTTDTAENPTDTPENPTEPAAESIASSIADAEAHMVSLVNELRKSLDVAPLEQHDGIAAVARRWSNTMHENDDFMHNPGWRAEYPAGWVTGGENIGKVSYHGDLISEVERAFDGLSDSPGHYQNMIRPAYGQIGVGIAIGSGFVWVTQNFACYPTDPESRTCDDTSGTADEVSLVEVAPPDPVFGAPLEAPCMDDSGPGRYITLETHAYNEGVPGHTYAVRTDGRLICLGGGLDAYGWPAVPSGNFVDITSGSTHHCALRTDKTLTCWTKPWQNNAPTLEVAPSGTFAAVNAGAFHTCALRAVGSIVCWGIDAGGETEAPDGDFKAITAGDSFSCGLRADSTVACWGSLTFSPSGSFTTIEAGAGDVCAVRTNDAGVCWNQSGLIHVPEGPFSRVYDGGSGFCGVRLNGSIECWGSSRFYRWHRHIPDGSFIQLSLGAAKLHDCGLRTDQTIVCWGNPNEALDNRNGSDYGLISSLGLTKLSRGASRYSGCGIRSDKTAVCWGRTVIPADRESSGFGIPVRSSLATDIVVIPGKYTSISETGISNTILCLLRTSGNISCTGSDSFSKLVNESSNATFIALASAPYSVPPAACGIRSDHTLVCWGYRDFVADVPSGTFTSVDLGTNYACAIRTSGSLECWGDADSFGTRLNVPEPPTGRYSEVSVGNHNACALRADDHNAVCWSWRPTFHVENGEYVDFLHASYRGLIVEKWFVRNGFRKSRYEVVETPEGVFVSISVSRTYACGLRMDHSIECWGFPLRPYALGGSYSAIDGQCGLRADSSFACRATLLPEGVTWNAPSVRCDSLDLPCDSETIDGLHLQSTATVEWQRADSHLPMLSGYAVSYSLNYLQRARSRPDKCWIGYFGLVYDVTPNNGYEYAGPGSILDLCGTDVTVHFWTDDIEPPDLQYVRGSLYYT